MCPGVVNSWLSLGRGRDRQLLKYTFYLLNHKFYFIDYFRVKLNYFASSVLNSKLYFSFPGPTFFLLLFFMNPLNKFIWNSSIKRRGVARGGEEYIPRCNFTLNQWWYPLKYFFLIICKEPVVKEPVYWNDLPCEIPQLDIPDVGSNHIISFFSCSSPAVKSFQ